MVKRFEERVKREDRRAGGIIAQIYNMNRDVEKDPKGLDWQDYFTEWKEEPEEQTEDQMFEAMMLWTKSTEGLSA